ncbi:PREDICTED: carboxylesterase 5A-like [Papilio polytes]|uniref:carboxylesterase 5A-like n=1 Tax=Papilio polytes TaxID=76194 RepID=UPI000675EE74|nr:PREDICTED: carboxylesterase 5A-like [Papilio polytes]
MRFFLLLCLITYIQKSNTNENNVNIKIQQGELAGKIERTLFKNVEYYSFRGIPYALPPTEELRFKAPVKHNKWDGIYEAFIEKPTCLQFSSRQRNGESFGISGSEDCLYLNVFTPNLKGSPAPVVVFDYNDNFKTGFNGSQTYAPDFFIEEDVIVVTINHRLGLFGYLTTDDDIIPGNNGLRDFILGLNWIKENIKQFGGDPDRVTLMGNRGGAVLIDTLLYSAKAKNLFSAAILQSGTSVEPFLFYDKPREAAFELGELCDINATDSATLLEGLQKIDAEILITKDVSVSDTTFDLAQLVIQPFSPIVEKNPDAVLTFLPESGLVVNDVPIIIGMNSREGLDLASPYIFEPRLLTDYSQDFFVHLPKRTGFQFDRNSTVFQEAVKEIQNFYFEEGYLYYNNILEYAVYVGDVLQNYALNLAAEKLSTDLKSSVYYYVFDFRGSLNENIEYMYRRVRFPIENWGATITDELCYLHLCTRIKKNYIKLRKLLSEQPDMKVLKNMVRLWTNFAKHRNPTPDLSDDLLKDFTWQPHNKEKNNYLHINKKLRMKQNPMGERVKFWDDFIAKYSALAEDGVVKDKNHDEL